MFATVVVTPKQGGIGNGLTYGVPRDLLERIATGQLVRVPLRKRLVEGIITELSEERPEGDFDLKEVREFLGDAPLLSEREVRLLRWIAEEYVCSLRQVLAAALPGMPWSRLLPEKEKFIRLREGGEAGKKERRWGKKQELLLEFLRGKDWVPWKGIKETVVGRDVLKRLLERGVVEMREETCFGSAQHDKFLLPSDVALTPRQTAACKAIKADPRPTLLFGITGSGKTEIYAALMREVITAGKSAMLLLPEILLTENFIERFQKLVAREAIAVVHSRLTPKARREAWRKIRSGAVRLVIGSRSAIFAPLPDLGLLIIDEEHEWTYKNEQSPRYHARTVAERLCLLSSSAALPLDVARSATLEESAASRGTPKLILGSATPSLESWYRAKSGRYQLVELPERYGSASLPAVRIIDLAEVPFGKHYPFSPPLLEAIRKRLDRHEQCVLFLNRRGFATSLLCLECRNRLEDPVTRLPYTVHHCGLRAFLLSHHTGEELPMPSLCPHCRSPRLREVGAGTERAEAILRELFPEAGILRADADTLRSPEQMRTLLAAMQSGRGDILLGTQSVVKGLDLPGVTLAAVLLADIGLSLPHFRAGERVFQLLTQLAGRSGRREPGEVIIQTFRPEALEVALAARHDVRGYLEQELAERVKTHYPPESELVRFVFSGPRAVEESRRFAEALPRRSGTFVSRAPSLFGGGNVWQVFLRGKEAKSLLKELPAFEGVVDVDPVECL